MSEWTPTPQAYRGPADPENGFRRVGEKFADAGRQMRDGLNHLLQSAGIRVEPGKLIIEGDLEVPNGKIKNEWLESPIIPATIGGNNSTFTIDAAEAALASDEIHIPDGYSQALVFVVSTTAFLNTSALNENVYVRTKISATGKSDVFGSQMYTGVDSGALESLTSHSKTHYTGLAGGTVSVSLLGKTGTGGGSMTSGANRADIDGVVFFLR